MSYKVHLNVFEGPLDLLLYFIKRDEINIYDIPIARITQEFLEYLEIIQTLNLRIAGEFIEMASTLMQIKAQMLIPRVAEAIENQTIEDPRTSLVERLIEYQKYKELSQELAVLEEQQLPFFPRKANNEHLEQAIPLNEVLQNVTLIHILAAFKKVLERIPETQPVHHVNEIGVSIASQTEFIYRHFIKSTKISFSRLAQSIKERVVLVVTFLALLEMVRSGQVKIRQTEIFEDFIIEKQE
jgi:segregation and condensation protein A